jgi:hypothetical protein
MSWQGEKTGMRNVLLSSCLSLFRICVCDLLVFHFSIRETMSLVSMKKRGCSWIFPSLISQFIKDRVLYWKDCQLISVEYVYCVSFCQGWAEDWGKLIFLSHLNIWGNLTNRMAKSQWRKHLFVTKYYLGQRWNILVKKNLLDLSNGLIICLITSEIVPSIFWSCGGDF